MSCPFYGASLHFDQLVRFPELPSNRCALITDAHSPCWMEAYEATPPDWSNCPRNPQWAAKRVVYEGTPDEARIIDHAIDLVRMIRMRAAFPAALPEPDEGGA